MQRHSIDSTVGWSMAEAVACRYDDVWCSLLYCSDDQWLWYLYCTRLYLCYVLLLYYSYCTVMIANMVMRLCIVCTYVIAQVVVAVDAIATLAEFCASLFVINLGCAPWWRDVPVPYCKYVLRCTMCMLYVLYISTYVGVYMWILRMSDTLDPVRTHILEYSPLQKNYGACTQRLSDEYFWFGKCK